MADNFNITLGSQDGPAIALDEIGGVKYQRVKVTWGADGTADDVDNSTKQLPIQGTVTANLGATDNAVLDDIADKLTTGSSHHRNIDANAETEVKGSAGTLHWFYVANMTAAVAYLHLYDALASAVTPGSTTPDFTLPIPTQGDTNGAGFLIDMDHKFANGITYVVTTTLDGSAGDPGTNGVILNAGYS